MTPEVKRKSQKIYVVISLLVKFLSWIIIDHLSVRLRGDFSDKDDETSDDEDEDLVSIARNEK